ncbi:hypothetical protein BpHYR1_009056 [Brachionus plicatilis]|uniref:C2 PI3K-type domain-containing protein n=1 Tax=Brachionus plicatilis TaxID=10195 RepID=A0A3M7QMM8_BRAPC|nr:hypothetical protein BpHYR1_009056 [Brachionus plicatilis]
MANKTEKPFGLNWLDSSYYETLLPSTPWQNIYDMISPELAIAVREQFKVPQRKQMLIELLGPQFKRSYLPDESDDALILNPPLMAEEQRKKLENEAKSWLQIKMNEIALKKKCAIKTNQSEDELSSEMKDYLEHTYNVVSTSLDRHLYLKQNNINFENLDDDKEPQSSVKQNDLRDALRKKKSESNEKTMPNLSSEFSEILSESLMNILKKDPRRIAFVLQKLIGQQLSYSLRLFIWSDILMRHERKKIEAGSMPIDIDLIVRKNFANGVSRGKNELKISDPSQTPISGLIENGVIETYSKVFCLNEFLNEAHLRQTMRILNVFYCYSRDYEPFYIYWLLPFQLTFRNERSKSELIYDLAMYLDLYVKNLFPIWNEIFTIAAKVVQDLSINDLSFYEHLKKISKINPKINSKDFVNEIIENEQKKTTANDETNVIRSKKELLTEPSIFVRKWIAEGFAGVLRKNALLYVWDQLFMSLWSSKDFEIIAKSLLYLLKNQFIKAKDHDEMRRVFLEGPYRLLTADIQSAFMHLSSGGKENEVAFLNTLNSNEDGSYYAKLEGSKSKSILDPIGIKDVYLKLVIPKQGLINDFDSTRIIVEISLYYGSQRLGKKQTTAIPIIKDVKPSIKESKTYELMIPSEKLVFEMSELKQDIHDSKGVFAIITIKYPSLSFSDFILGYCKMSIYSPQKIGSLSTWEVINGRVKRLLHPGAPPEDFEKIGSIPTASFKDRLGPDSNVELTLYDPNSESYFRKSKEFI